MIGYLKGRIIEVEQGKWIVEVNGVGYRVQVPQKMFSEQTVGSEVTMRIFTYVKEDALALFGFRDGAELDLFEKMLAVSGVGPRVALSVFEAGSVGEIVRAVRRAEVEFFTNVSGIGKKGAQRIIMELSGKLGSEAELDLTDSPEKDMAVQGLVGLGFLKAEALEALKKVDGKLPAEKQIKLALKNGK